jgi:hypothetical protein
MIHIEAFLELASIVQEIADATGNWRLSYKTAGLVNEVRTGYAAGEMEEATEACTCLEWEDTP